ncbi:MAG: hypothetical protein KME21_00530 [Desmonostoc vinosum HA7617-LM4]|jgi:hypothetical protein|nr:hypothetical protein [Desmonostoc vinosum HA7617-LM4]
MIINSQLTNILLIAGIVCLIIAVIGNSKLGFVEINPGCFGRLLALTLGTLSLVFAVGLGNLPLETLDSLKTYLSEQIQQNISSINEILQRS